MPIFERIYAIIGNSKINPALKSVVVMKLKYSVTSILFLIRLEPKEAVKESITGIMIQYANATPTRKQKEVYIVIFPAQRLSFS